jgi:hypothetical protein
MDGTKDGENAVSCGSSPAAAPLPAAECQRSAFAAPKRRATRWVLCRVAVLEHASI